MNCVNHFLFSGDMLLFLTGQEEKYWVENSRFQIIEDTKMGGTFQPLFLKNSPNTICDQILYLVKN